VVIRGRASPDFRDRHDDDPTMVDTEDRISYAKARDGAVTVRRCDRRVGRSADARRTSERTGSARVARIDATNAGPWEG
jgi:hypothetical protein